MLALVLLGILSFFSPLSSVRRTDSAEECGGVQRPFSLFKDVVRSINTTREMYLLTDDQLGVRQSQL